MHRVLVVSARLVALALALVSCRRPPPAPTTEGPPSPTLPVAAAPVLPVRTVDVPVPGDLPAFAVRGGSTRSPGDPHRRQMLFVPGMCVHPGGYVTSFQHAAAARGDLVAVQGDVSCNDAFGGRRWSSDLDAMDRRIDAAFRAAGLGEPRGVLVIGYSQGAERAEKLVARFPAKYTAAILIASPVTPSSALLERVEAVGLMAGTFDLALGTHRQAIPVLRRAGIPAAFFALPGARHGQMGEHPEESMREVLDYMEETRQTKNLGPRASHGGLPMR